MRGLNLISYIQKCQHVMQSPNFSLKRAALPNGDDLCAGQAHIPYSQNNPSLGWAFGKHFSFPPGKEFSAYPARAVVFCMAYLKAERIRGQKPFGSKGTEGAGRKGAVFRPCSEEYLCVLY